MTPENVIFKKALGLFLGGPDIFSEQWWFFIFMFVKGCVGAEPGGVLDGGTTGQI